MKSIIDLSFLNPYMRTTLDNLERYSVKAHKTCENEMCDGETCKSCCEHDDMDGAYCMNCDTDLTEDLACRAYDMFKDRDRD